MPIAMHTAPADAAQLDIRCIRITASLVDPLVIDLLPHRFMLKHNVLPMFAVRGMLTVAMAQPSDVYIMDEIERLTGCSVQVVAGSAADIRQMLARLLPDRQTPVLKTFEDDFDPHDYSWLESSANRNDCGQVASGATSIDRWTDHLIAQAVRAEASGIHIDCDGDGLRVRYRVNGRMQEQARPPRKLHGPVMEHVKSMAGLDILQQDLPQSGDVTVLLADRPIDLHVTTMPEKQGEKAVIQVIGRSRTRLSLDDLGLGYETARQFRQMLRQSSGLIVVTGPAGCGKSTTLGAAMELFNPHELNISTIEQSIRVERPGISQYQPNQAIGFNAHDAMVGLLQQSADVIVLDARCDSRTIRLTTQAATTDSLVLTAMSSGDAPVAIRQLIHMGVQPILLAGSLHAVLAQRLVRKICNVCKEPVDPSPAMRGVAASIGKVDTCYRGKGCSRCRHTGYDGRIGIFEWLVPSDALREAIASGERYRTMNQLAQASDRATLIDDGLMKVKAGLTTIDEVVRVVGL